MSFRVSLTKTIYPQECLEGAVAAYSAICSVNVTEDAPGTCEVEIAPVQGEAELADEGRIAHEFLNYLLDLSLEYHLQRS